MNRLSTPERAAIVAGLVEGNSIRATCRITGRDKETVMRLLSDIGAACDVYQGGAPETSVALHFMHYNFCRVHQTLRTTPAMAAGIADHVWSIEELVGLLRRPVQSNKAA